MPKKFKANIFRDAAERIASLRSHSCCFALDGALPTISESNQYIELLRVSLGVPMDADAFWWNDEDCNAREARILALLLCAEMCKD